ncbi:hypothetical protein Bbelb_352110 [Branchiostoma belcheri]|nr:hypothetical protein Bbelb_352110 [Branchiostoma belcheri]
MPCRRQAAQVWLLLLAAFPPDANIVCGSTVLTTCALELAVVFSRQNNPLDTTAPTTGTPPSRSRGFAARLPRDHSETFSSWKDKLPPVCLRDGVVMVSVVIAVRPERRAGRGVHPGRECSGAGLGLRSLPGALTQHPRL